MNIINLEEGPPSGANLVGHGRRVVSTDKRQIRGSRIGRRVGRRVIANATPSPSQKMYAQENLEEIVNFCVLISRFKLRELAVARV